MSDLLLGQNLNVVLSFLVAINRRRTLRGRSRVPRLGLRNCVRCRLKCARVGRLAMTVRICVVCSDRINRASVRCLPVDRRFPLILKSTKLTSMLTKMTIISSLTKAKLCECRKVSTATFSR